jgi:hypothetical protein
MVERDEWFVITRRDRWTNSRCEVCDRPAQMVTLAEAARIAQMSELVICAQIQTRSLHSTETADGRVLICLNSLLK